jgi:hypothetical protein
MTSKVSANQFAYASLVCSLSFWLGLILSYVPGAPRLNFPGVLWLAIMGAGVALAVVAAVLNFEKKLWILAGALALGSFFFVMYVIGS